MVGRYIHTYSLVYIMSIGKLAISTHRKLETILQYNIFSGSLQPTSLFVLLTNPRPPNAGGWVSRDIDDIILRPFPETIFLPSLQTTRHGSGYPVDFSLADIVCLLLRMLYHHPLRSATSTWSPVAANTSPPCRGRYYTAPIWRIIPQRNC